ncbi:hypothetical protein BGY98DRAFT_311867 [Russula aff. rugulosa BPL654]|nr:hypothetical protein BGY98DRAFT_311867 [Russula aff. rugulosa BPL654]
MHRYRIIAQISLILSILNLVLAAPIVATMPKKLRELEAASHGSTRMSPRSSQDAVTSPQHPSLSDGSTSSGYPTPHLSSDSSESGYSWLLSRPPRLSLYESVSPYLSSSGSSERPPSLPLLLQGLPSPPSSFSSPGSLEIPPSPALPGSDQAATETSSPPERFTPSRHSSSLSSMSWHSDGLAPSHNSISEGSPPTETPQDNVKFFNKIMMKKLGIVVGVVIVGGIVGGIVGSQIKHRDSQDS